MIFSMFYQTQRSTLGTLTIDVLLKEALELPSEATKYPVEDGGPDITDHITQSNERLDISGSVSSASDMMSMEFGGGCYSKLIDAVETLREMHDAREPITVVTGLGVYEDMAFTGMTVTRNSGNEKGGAWLDIDATLMKIRFVSLKEADLPPEQASAKGRTGQTEKRGGASGSQNKAPENPNGPPSVLSSLTGIGA
jgi:hypothetical protein